MTTYSKGTNPGRHDVSVCATQSHITGKGNAPTASSVSGCRMKDSETKHGSVSGRSSERNNTAFE
jgi:hypothetical protein